MRRPQLLRFIIALVIELLCCGALNLFDDWTLEQMPVRFVVTAILGGVAYLVAVTQFPRLTTPAQASIFWAVTIALRLVVLPLAPGDDFWRYQWEGKIQQFGFNPYLQAPDDPKLEAVRTDFPQWPKINHHEYRAIYPPGAELVFAALSRISDRALFYKLVFAGADLAAIGVLLRLIGGTERYSAAAWYAWSPLVIYSFAGAAHFDSLMILPMTGGILILTRFEAVRNRRTKWLLALAASAAFGIAISVKLVPALLLLCCFFALRLYAVTLVVSGAIPVLLSTLYGYPKIKIWESLGHFAYLTRLNDLFWWLVEATIWPNPHQKNYHYNVILIIAVAVVSLIFCRNWKRGMIWAFGTALILSPVLHPWYCAWILPLATWRRAYAWFVFSVTLFAYYLFWNEHLFLLPWHAEGWMRAIIIVPALVAAVLLTGRKRGRGGVME